MILLLALALAATGACADQLIAPSVHLDTVAQFQPTIKTGTGCSTYDVTINPSGQVRVVADTTAPCGPAVPIVLPQASFDTSLGVLRLEVSVRNAGRLRLYGPLTISIAKGGLRVVQPNQSAGALQVVDNPHLPGQVAWARQLGIPQANTGAPDSTAPSFLEPKRSTLTTELAITVPTGMRAFRLTLTGSGTIRYTVPLRAPARMPDSVLKNSNSPVNRAITRGSRSIVVRNAVLVRFKPSANSDDRQEAIDAIDGTVVGGSLGMYYVRIPVPDSIKDWSVVRAALATLNRMPQVDIATVHSLIGVTPLYVRPADAGGFAKAQWQLNPDSARGIAWGEEYVRAPHAWGCTTGNAKAAVAVADGGFHDISDLHNNVAATAHFSANGDHGTKVASIIAAQGNNGIGMTGLAWDANLGLFDIDNYGTDSTFTGPYAALLAAGTAGYSIINVSFGIYWQATGGLPDSTSGVDSATALAAAGQFKRVLDSLGTINKRPLFVVAAGNDGIDAFWTGLPAVKNLGNYSSQTLVVSAIRNTSTAAGRLATFSDRGPLVDIAAPGDSVGVADGSGTVESASGTSFSAPYVSGVGGLLMAFDSMTGPDSIRAYTLDGATSGGRYAIDPSTGDSIYVLDAYAALKRSAQRTGAPLCGNIMWANHDSLMVMRSSSIETIKTIPDHWIFFPGVYHGGRQITLATAPDSNASYLADCRLLTLTNSGSWSTSVTSTCPARGVFDLYPYADSTVGRIGGAFNASMGVSHDGDSTARLTYNDATAQYDLIVNGRTLIHVSPDTAWYSAIAYSPLGDFVYLALGRDTLLPSNATFTPSDRTISSIRISDGHVTQLSGWTATDVVPAGMTVSEDGKTLMVWSMVSLPNGPSPPGPIMDALVNCRMDVRNVDGTNQSPSFAI